MIPFLNLAINIQRQISAFLNVTFHIDFGFLESESSGDEVRVCATYAEMSGILLIAGLVVKLLFKMQGDSYLILDIV